VGVGFYGDNSLDMIARKIFLNFGYLTMGKFLGDVFTFLFFVLLSRTFGEEGIGQYSFGMAFTGFFAVFADYGLFPFTIKEISKRNESFGNFFGRILSLRLVLSTGAVLMLLFVLPFLPFSATLRSIILFIGTYQIAARLIEGIGAAFIAEEDSYLAGLLDAGSRGTVALTGSILAMAGASLSKILFGVFLVGFGFLALAFVIVWRKYERPKLTMELHSLRELICESTPYALSLFSFQAYSRIGIVLLGFLMGASAAGVYNVAYRVIFVLTFVPQFAGISLLPQAAKLFVDSRKELATFYSKALNVTVLIGLPAAGGLWLIAPGLIGLIFGSDFAASVSVLRILTFMLLLTCINRIAGVFLICCDLQGKRMKSQWVAVVANGIASALLIPRMGVEGAAMALSISEIVTMMLFLYHLKPVLGLPKCSSRLAISCIGVAAFWLPLTILRCDSLWVVIPASVVIYGGVVFGFKRIRENEGHDILSLLKRAY
jgi:O-antigen/teichoic acid export membrane protein